MIDPDA